MSEETNTLTVLRDGPNVVTGDLEVVTPTRVRRLQTAMLCRCGHTKDMPFCDGAHVKVGFTEPARLPADVITGIAHAGKLTITPLPNGPNRCDGPLTIRDSERRTSASDSTLLCRCGASRRKPYCDGSHNRQSGKGPD